MKDFKTKNGFFTGNVGIGTTNPERKLEISADNNGDTKSNYIRITDTDTTATLGAHNGGIEFYSKDSSGQPGLSAAIESIYAGSGGGGEISLSTSANSGADLVEAMRIDNSGNVGIGTTSPDEKLEVIGDVLIQNGVDSTLYLGKGVEGVDGVVKIKSTQTGTDTDELGLSFFVHGSASGTTPPSEALSIKHDGNVGIGTTSPSAKLHINGGTVNNQAIFESTDGTSSVLFKDPNGTAEFGNRGDNAVIMPAGVEKMRITSNGNVGIGTTNPLGKLSIESANATSYAAHIVFNNTAGAKDFALGAGIHGSTNSGFGIIDRNTNDAFLYISDTGNVGIGTTNPGAVKFVVHGSVQCIQGYRSTSTSTQDLFTLNSDVGATNSTKFRIEADGTAYTGSTPLSSDDRLKHNEQEIFGAIETLSKITPKKYIKTSNLYEPNHDFQLDESGNPIDENGKLIAHHIEAGVIAQQVLNVPELKFLVREEKLDEDGNTVWPYSLDYNSLFTYAIAAIQEQQTIIEDLKSQNESLIARIEALEG